jgi:hypothetical protein
MAVMWRTPTLTLVAIAAMVLPATAQRRVHAGVKAGPSFTTIVLDEDDGRTYHRRIAAAGGGFVTLPLDGRFAVQIEALSNPKGARLEDADENLTETLKLRYFEFPVLLRVGGPTHRMGAWYFIGGGWFGIRTSAKAQTSFVANSFVSGVVEDARDLIERYESGMVAGAGLDIGRFLVIEGRYARGLTNANKVADSPAFTSRAVTFMVGLRY